jgi:hypothetical protein
MIVSLLSRQLFATLNLSLMILCVYFAAPAFALSTIGIAFCALGMGLYIALTTYRSSWNVERRLQFVPSEKYKKMFEEQIEQVGLQPSQVSLRYAYNDDGVGLTLFNTVMVDPMLWKGIEDDPAFLNAQQVINMQIIPALPEEKKKLHAQLNALLTQPVQRFIFKHELGHVADQFSYKKIALIGCIGFVSTANALFFTQATINHFNGWMVFVGAVIIAMFTDLFLSYSSNIFFKARKEKAADFFAAKTCSKEEIEAAADFFEGYEVSAQEFRKSSGETFTDSAPMFFRGYIDGKNRAHYLREIAQSK